MSKPVPKPKEPIKGKRPLKARDDKFVDLVSKGTSPSKAYVAAGFKKTKNTRINASQKLTNPNIVARLEERKAYYRSIADVEAEQIIGAQQEIAFASIEDALDNDGNLDFAKAKKTGAAKLIKKITRSDTLHGERVVVEFYSRSDALTQLADILGLKQLPRLNERDIEVTKLVGQIEMRAREKGIPYEQELKYYLDHYANDVKPEVKTQLTQLASDLTM